MESGNLTSLQETSVSFVFLGAQQVLTQLFIQYQLILIKMATYTLLVYGPSQFGLVILLS